jgi:hypothetical protein
MSEDSQENGFNGTRLEAWALNATTCLLRRGSRGTSDTERKRQCDHGNQRKRDVTTSHGMLAATRTEKWDRLSSQGRVALQLPWH